MIAGLQFGVDYNDEYDIRVVNLSMSSTVALPYRVDPLNAAAEAAWFSGLVVVTAAGNRGTAADVVSYAPANTGRVREARPRGARRAHRRPARTAERLRRPVFAAPCSACIVDERSFRIGGTSMSWQRAGWKSVDDPLAWRRASRRCVCDEMTGGVLPARASWKRATWSSFLGETPTSPVPTGRGSKKR